MGKDQKSGNKTKPIFSKETLEEILSKHVERLALGYPAGQKADLREFQLLRAHLEGANLIGANFKDSDVTATEYDRNIKCHGIRLDRCFGSTHFESFAKNQAFIGELEKGNFRKWFLYSLWNIFADCGRTPWRWILWMTIFVCYFAGLIFWMGQEQFRVAGEQSGPVIQASTGNTDVFQDRPLPWTYSTTLYYSVVTFSTLGFGDITPRTPTATWVVTAEVLLGYIILGGLISIFAILVTKPFLIRKKFSLNLCCTDLNQTQEIVGAPK